MHSFTPSDVGHSYDEITRQWETPAHPLTGLAAHQKAVQFLASRGHALDVGCGCNGRLIEYLKSENFFVDGVDVSERMVALARQRNPDVRFHHADICEWILPRKYNFITGWDSIWHVPLTNQGRVLEKLCGALNRGGVFIFTLGGVGQPGEIQDNHMGVPMYTGTLGIPKTLELIAHFDCVCRHLEYDQFPQPHAYLIAQKS
jgi:SAM-dependent methyltransferase